MCSNSPTKPMSFEPAWLTEMPKEDKCTKTPWIIGLAATVIIASGLAIAAYILVPQAHQFVNSTVSHLETGMTSIHLSTLQSTLLIGLPASGAVLTVSFVIYVYKRHQARLKDDQFLLKEDTTVLKTLAEMRPSGKQILITGLVIATLLALAAGGYAAFKWVPDVHQWINQQAIPFVQNIMNQQWALWQSIAFFGAGSAVSTTATLMAISLIKHGVEKCRDTRKIEQEHQAQNTFYKVQPVEPPKAASGCCGSNEETA